MTLVVYGGVYGFVALDFSDDLPDMEVVRNVGLWSPEKNLTKQNVLGRSQTDESEYGVFASDQECRQHEYDFIGHQWVLVPTLKHLRFVLEL